MHWDKEKIFNKVIKSADTYGARNHQQKTQLLLTLSNVDSQEVYDGLLNIFKIEHKKYSIRQELAGLLLYIIKPNAHFDAYKDLMLCLKNYELSVEQLPYFYIDKLGKDEFKKILNDMRKISLSKRELKALNTFEFWARNYDKFSRGIS